ncbi:DUF739 family protein [Megasphaera sp. UBA4382]|jgi:DNA-binding XRE family transcriptional regulator|uniref:DUF739 family protein n=1 Tax=Megasphaera sp. UBA4382 TaxID=1946850 RepID=UPI0025C21087|nr:DUF739 family protein [Megasphaera sp. UBA4382]
MKYNYSKLIGRLAEMGITRDEFASKIGVSRTALYNKMQSETEFTQDEIKKSVDVLNIPWNDISLYFFTLKV